MKRLCLALIILILGFTEVYAAISASTIFYAPEEDLKKMLSQRGLVVTGTANEMRSTLYNYEGLLSYQEEVKPSSDYTIQILSANNLINQDKTTTLQGNASISFKNGREQEKIISATQIIIDSDNKKLTALDNVVFKDNDRNATLNNIEADIFSIFWDSGLLYITDATTFSERRNSEGDKINFYTQGDMLSFNPDGGMLYQNGYMTSNPETRYSSINAHEIAILPGEDMFISSATLSVGRVPLLYLPFFFTPGSRLVGNPSFGFQSTRGMFLNTTFELLGNNPKIEQNDSASSFSAIFKSGNINGDLYPTSSYYESIEDENLTDAQKWAKNSKSYVSFYLDAFSGSGSQSVNEEIRNGGLNFAFDSEINLFSNTLSFKIFDGFGLSDVVPSTKNASNLRFYGENSFSFNNYGLSINASLPLYSDSYVLEDFGNRIIGFSIDPLLGSSPEFPNTYSSYINSMIRELNFSYSLPYKYLNKYISSFSISDFSLKEAFNWEGLYENDSSNYLYSYRLDNVVLPSLGLNLTGAIFDINKDYKIVDNEKKEEKIDITDFSILNDPLLRPLYIENSQSSNQKANKSFSTSLKYSISETLDNQDNYSYGLLSASRFSTNTSARLTYSASFSNWFNLSDVINPTYSYQEDVNYQSPGEKSNYSIQDTDSFTMQNALSLSFPILGLSYSLTTKLLSNMNSEKWDVSEDVEGEENKTKTETKLNLGWNKDTVTYHQVSFSKAFKTNYGILTPSLSYTLLPLIGALEPKLSYSYNTLSAAFSWRFSQNEENKSYSNDLIQLSLGYSMDYFTLSSNVKYNSVNYKADNFFHPLSLNFQSAIRTKDKKWSINGSLDYSVYSESKEIENYFNSIQTVFTLPYTALTLNWKTQEDTKKVEFNNYSFSFNLSSKSFQAWKGRIYIAFALNTNLNMNIKSRVNSSLTFSPSFTFSIAEFLDFKFILNSYNNNMDSYYNENGQFEWKSMFDDLFRSVDFVGNGRNNTYFLMRNFTLQVVHYMEDWDLNIQYNAEVTRINNSTYRLLPKFSVYMAWKTLPEIKVDQKWKQEGSGLWVEE